MSAALSKSYSLAALLIHSTKQDVSADKIKSVFDALGLEYSSKVASMFELSADRYDAMITSVSSSASSVQAGASSQAAQVEDAKAEEPEEESDDDVLCF
ncbi:hypothetical protein PAEPH01_0853 [Pancytospora epiphaga]|nr:hypothetical protein PAEPH01_0853 [Pancytospora epiphaga]